MSRHRRSGAALALTGALLLGACSGDGPDGTARTDVTADDAPHAGPGEDSALTSAPGSPPELPGTVAGEQARWVLHHLDSSAPAPGIDQITERFDDAFLEQVPPAQLLLVFGQLRSAGPYTVTEVISSDLLGPGTVQVRLDAAEPVLMTLVVDTDGLITGLLFQPDGPLEVPELGSWEQLDAALGDLDGTSQAFVGQVTDGTCVPVHTSSGMPPGGEPMPSGSVFKLLVLSVLVDAVEAGDLTWDDELTITPEIKSLPSGRLQDEPDGATVTVQETAELMIAISDNTATDLLIDTLGRQRIEESLSRLGVEEPERLIPFLTTRELFLLGWGAPQVREQWAGASPAEQAELLAQLPEDVTTVEPATITEPVWQEGLDWFFTGQEICSVHARLQQQAVTAAGAPVRDILAENPGLESPEGTAYLAFKGGSAPGVLATSFYLEQDGQAPGGGRVLVTQTASQAPVDQREVLGLAQAGLYLLAGG